MTIREIGYTQPIHLDPLFHGDKNAWETFVRQYSPLIWKAINRTFRSYSFPYTNEDAEDVYCAVFLSLLDNDFNKLKKFAAAQACSLSTFLTVITVRGTIDYLRKERHRWLSNSSTDDGITALLEAIPDLSPGVDQLLEEEEKHANFRKALELLSARDKEMYGHIFRKGMSAEEVACKLDVSVTAVYLRKNRLVEKIKKNMKEISDAYV